MKAIPNYTEAVREYIDSIEHRIAYPGENKFGYDEWKRIAHVAITDLLLLRKTVQEERHAKSQLIDAASELLNTECDCGNYSRCSGTECRKGGIYGDDCKWLKIRTALARAKEEISKN